MRALREVKYPANELGVIFLLIFLTGTSVRATTFRPASGCESFPHAAAVFLGRVVTVEELPDGGTRTRFSVEEAFKGISEAEVVVLSKRMLDLEAVHVHEGEEYLVFAGQDAEHRFGMSWPGVLPARLATSEISFLRMQQQENAPKTIVYGTLVHFANDGEYEGVPSIRVRLVGASGSYQSVTSKDGYFRISQRRCRKVPSDTGSTGYAGRTLARSDDCGTRVRFCSTRGPMERYHFWMR